jgi:hypothetical protein
LLPTGICHKRLSVWKKINFINLENLGHLLNEKSIGPNHIFKLKLWRKFTSSKIGGDVAKFGLKPNNETAKESMVTHIFYYLLGSESQFGD